MLPDAASPRGRTVDRLVQCRGGFIDPGLADVRGGQVAQDDGLGLGAGLELPGSRFQDRGGVARDAEEQVTGACQPAGPGWAGENKAIAGSSRLICANCRSAVDHVGQVAGAAPCPAGGRAQGQAASGDGVAQLVAEVRHRSKPYHGWRGVSLFPCRDGDTGNSFTLSRPRGSLPVIMTPRAEEGTGWPPGTRTAPPRTRRVVIPSTTGAAAITISSPTGSWPRRWPPWTRGYRRRARPTGRSWAGQSGTWPGRASGSSSTSARASPPP